MAIDETNEIQDQTPVFRAIFGIFRRKNQNLTPGERRLLLRLLGQIAPHADLSARVDMAHWLADDPGADPDLVRLLVNGPAEVAGPLIERSCILTPGELAELAKTRPADIQCAIARRPQLPCEVSAALVESGDPEIIKALLANTTARISEEVFEAVGEAAREHAQLRGPLRERHDTPRKLAETLSSELAADAERRAAALADKLHRAGHLRVSVLVGALRQGQTALFEHAIALLTGVPAVDLRELLRDRTGFPLALAARAARLDRSAFSTVFVKYCEARGVSPQLDETDLARAMEVFRNLPQEGARAELHRLAGRGAGGAPARRLSGGTLLRAWR